jgi:diaminopimelate decarboxylase/aspartate kinase
MTAVDRWHYALKANANPAVLRTLVNLGFELECVSLGELAHARRTFPGLAGERLLFTPNFAPRAEYQAALAAGVRVTLDSLHPLEHWPDLFRGRELVLRLDLGYGRGHHDKVVTGGAGAKFGLPLADLDAFRARCNALEARVVALHAHLGSGIVDPDHWRGIYSELATLAERFPHCTALDLGGGLGVPARAGDAELDLVALDRLLGEVKALYPQYALWLEPGRYPVADAGVLLGRVTQVKRKAGTLFVGIDAGMNSLIRPALYGAYHEIANLSRLDERADSLCCVVGPICESSDVLGTERLLPEPREGDVMLIAQVGAYGRVMSSPYTQRDEAEEVVIE